MFCFLISLVFKPIKFNSSIIVKISCTKGMFFIFTLLANIEAAKIGKVAFLDPDIEIFPLKSLLPLIISFFIKKIKLLEVLHLFVSYIYLFYLHKLRSASHFLLKR